MNSRDFSKLASSTRAQLIKKLGDLIFEKRISIEEFELISQSLEEIVYAERMNVHKLYDESHEEARNISEQEREILDEVWPRR